MKLVKICLFPLQYIISIYNFEWCKWSYHQNRYLYLYKTDIEISYDFWTMDNRFRQFRLSLLYQGFAAFRPSNSPSFLRIRILILIHNNSALASKMDNPSLSYQKVKPCNKTSRRLSAKLWELSIEQLKTLFKSWSIFLLLLNTINEYLTSTYVYNYSNVLSTSCTDVTTNLNIILTMCLTWFTMQFYFRPPGGGYFHRNAIRGCAAQMGRFLTKNP